MAHDAQGCFPILPTLWQLLVNKKSNIKYHSEIGNFITYKTFHEVGIGFCRPNQTHKQVH
jgi:hypothetical protein